MSELIVGIKSYDNHIETIPYYNMKELIFLKKND